MRFLPPGQIYFQINFDAEEIAAVRIRHKIVLMMWNLLLSQILTWKIFLFKTKKRDSGRVQRLKREDRRGKKEEWSSFLTVSE